MGWFFCRSQFRTPGEACFQTATANSARTDDLGHGTGHRLPFPLIEAQMMNADAIHAALGLTFTAIWLLVGQILVGNR